MQGVGFGLRWRLGYAVVNGYGLSGGLMVLWHGSTDVTLRKCHERYINMEVGCLLGILIRQCGALSISQIWPRLERQMEAFREVLN